MSLVFQFLSWERNSKVLSIRELVDALRPDPWRQANPFAAEVDDCHQILFDPSSSRVRQADALSTWLNTKPHQPCLFARHAANKGWLSFCIINENDIARGDEHIRAVIRDHRVAWKDGALDGGQHGFLILMISERIARAEPGPDLLALAQRLCQLYLSDDSQDEMLYDRLFLRIKPRDGQPAEIRKWTVGVNWFGAQADGRWWQDHRIPGGVGFSMNSVGHMARRLLEGAIDEDPDLARKAAATPAEKLVKWAVPLAMSTILTASKGSMPGTRLVPREEGILPDGLTEQRRAEVLGRMLSEYSENHYRGWYHTDVSIPSEYFDPAPERPEVEEKRLLFTYLHRRDDEDYESMGLGETATVLDRQDYEGMGLSESVLEAHGLSDFDTPEGVY